VIIGVPVMFGLAWVQEAIDDRRLRHQSI